MHFVLTPILGIFFDGQVKRWRCKAYIRCDRTWPTTPERTNCLRLRADAETKADDFHRLIWNQDVVPFVLIYTPLGVKLYSGFRHQRRRNGHTAGILQP